MMMASSRQWKLMFYQRPPTLNAKENEFQNTLTTIIFNLSILRLYVIFVYIDGEAPCLTFTYLQLLSDDDDVINIFGDHIHIYTPKRIDIVAVHQALGE